MAQLKKRTLDEVHRQDRGWGFELWIENNTEYCGKLLFVEKGKRGSFHFHVDKLETMYLSKGRVDLRMVDTETGREYVVELQEGDSIRIPRNQPHQIIGVEESVITEFSTPHREGDSLRLQKGD